MPACSGSCRHGDTPDGLDAVAAASLPDADGIAVGRSTGAASVRQITIPMFVLLVVAESLVVGVTPLLPTYASRLSLSGVGASALLASTSFALLLVALPVGLVADTIGARRLTLASGVAMCLASLAQAAPFDYWWLLADRAIVGVAVGTFWTAGLAWLAGLSDGPRSPLGIGVTMAGIGIVLGPGLIGVLAQALGVGAPFILLGAVIGVLLPVLAFADSPAVPVADQRASFLRVMAAAARRPRMRSALIGLAASAIGSGTLWVIVPLELHSAGESTGTIGVVLFLTGLGYVVASAAVARLGARIVTIGMVAMTSAALGACMLPGSLSSSAFALILCAALITPLRGALATLCFELGASAAGAGLGTGSIVGCLNSVWGAVTVITPLAAGAIFDAAGGRTAFACSQVAVLALALCTAVGLRRV